MNYKNVEKELLKLKDKAKSEILARFFKTGPGQYGEGDKFLGIIVPKQREVAKKFIDLDLEDVKKLLASSYHEARLTASFILVAKYEKGDKKIKKTIAEFYLKNLAGINNWDLVDLTTPKILGDYLFDKDKKILYNLVKSNNLWERRVAILATFGFIKKNDFIDCLKISKILLNDKHDLIHKAVGWMLREVGKRDLKIEEEFLNKYYKLMPRTMLRYAIERLPVEKRNYYMIKVN